MNFDKLYETLFDVLRAEKQSNNASALQANWFETVDEFCSKHKSEIKPRSIMNLLKLLDDLYWLRESKVIEMSRIKARFDSQVDTSNLLDHELRLLNLLVSNLKTHKSDTCKVTN